MVTKTIFIFLLVLVGACMSKKLEAIARFTSGLNKSVKGVVIFKEVEDGFVEVKGRVYGLSPGKHGLHIHENGNIDNSCANVGHHFDPYGEPHGVHVGDLANLNANDDGVADFSFMKRNINLSGKYSIIGKSVGIDDVEDVYGDEESKPIACGIIRKMDNKKKHKHHHGECKNKGGRD